jgi:hypothetical protein
MEFGVREMTTAPVLSLGSPNITPFHFIQVIAIAAKLDVGVLMAKIEKAASRNSKH